MPKSTQENSRAETMTTAQPEAAKRNAGEPEITGSGGCVAGTTLNATASAKPAGELAVGTVVQLVGAAEAVTVHKDCSRTVQHVETGNWSLSFQAAGANGETDVTALLASTNGLTTRFTVQNEGLYRATFRAELGLNTAYANVSIVAGVVALAPQRILEAGSLSGGPIANPPHPTDPANPDPSKWAAYRCHYRTISDSGNLTSSNPTIEWSPILTDEELGGDVGMSGTVVQVKFDDADNDFSRDMPFSHPFYNDYRCQIVPDEPYMSLLAPGNLDKTDGDWQSAAAEAKDLGISAPGFLELEIDRGLLPSPYRPRKGDRVAVWGRWIVDCGHDIFSTEIHPPLVLATARATSDDSTSVTILGRAFLISQNYGGTVLFPYIAREMVKLNAEIIASGGIAGVFLPPIAARPKILSPPFTGIKIMDFKIRPPRPRRDSSERLLLSYHFVTRSGVTVQVAGGQADDEIQVLVNMNDVAYKPASSPPSHDITVPLEALTLSGAGMVELIVSLNPAAAPVLNQGIVTTRYDMPPAASAKDHVNVIRGLLITGGPIPSTDTPEQPIDDSQPYPIYGWLTLGFSPSNRFVSDAAPGATSAGNVSVTVAKSLDGRIFYNWWELGQGGRGWKELEGNGRTNAAPAAALVGNYLFVVVKGLDGNLYLNQGELGKPFVGWQPFAD